MEKNSQDYLAAGRNRAADFFCAWKVAWLMACLVLFPEYFWASVLSKPFLFYISTDKCSKAMAERLFFGAARRGRGLPFGGDGARVEPDGFSRTGLPKERRLPRRWKTRIRHMDLATILGLVLSFGLISAALAGDGGDIGLFIHGPSMLIVFGGTLGATLTHYPLPTVLNIWKVIAKTFSSKTPHPQTIIDQLFDFANRARREGILSLESAVGTIDDPYLRKGMQLTIDGLEPELIQEILEAEISSTEERHETGIELLNAMAAYAPALGMIGTVIGLVQMLKNMNDPAAIGPAMAVALITTFYGAILANLVFLPLMGKLRQRSKEEIQIMEIQLEGLLGISRGENPRVIAEKMNAFQAPQHRKQVG